jgi:hypothetical protein
VQLVVERASLRVCKFYMINVLPTCKKICKIEKEFISNSLA